jgi:hypothetical protein
MPSRSRAILVLGLFSVLAGLFIFLDKGDPTGERGIPPKARDPNTGHPTPAADSTDETLPPKSKPRSPTSKISKARTLALLQTPIPGPVEFPEQTLAERVSAINQWLEQAGIARDQLRIAVEARTAPRNLNLLLERFAVEDETPSTVLKYTAGSTRLYFLVYAGTVEFAEVNLVPLRPDQPAAEPAATD